MAILSESLSTAGPVTITIGGYIRCRDCKSWGAPQDSDYGHCYKQGPDMAMTAQFETNDGYYDAMLWTRAEFGCTEGRLQGTGDERD